MYWAPFLHIYQPPTQFRQVLRKISKDSYLKIIEILKKNSNAYLTLNICASLTEQLADQFPKIISELKNLVKSGQIELTGSAAYHPLLSKLPKSEIARQIRLNSEINKKYFGQVWHPSGFFPPEMAYSPQVGDAIEEAGFKWVILEEFAYPGKYIPRDRIFKRRKGNLRIFFRERELSLAIAFSAINSISKFEKYLGGEIGKAGYLITAMDGETFGHHQKGQERFLNELYQFGKPPSITISEILTKFKEVEVVEPVLSTWGITEKDCREGKIYPRWDLPNNPIHALQWQLTKLAIKSVDKIPNLAQSQSRKLLDRALHSDQYWWASANPSWHYKMVVKGAEMLSAVVESSPSASAGDKHKAANLKEKISNLGLTLYGDTIIDR